MSTIRVDNFSPSAGGTSFGIEGIAKAAWNYDQATGPTVNASINVASITDSAAGLFVVNLSNDFSDADWFAAIGSPNRALTSSNNACGLNESATQLASAASLRNQRSDGTEVDVDDHSGLIAGGLA